MAGCNLISQSKIMISAVAARKAARALQLQQQEQQEQQQEQITSATTTQISTPRSPKRKPSTQRSNPLSKKRKQEPIRKPNSVPSKTPIITDVFKTQEDVIVIDSSSDNESVIEVLSDEESDIVEIVQPPVSTSISVPTPQRQQRKRAWSPSRPLDGNDSSSEEEDATEMVDIDLIDVPSRYARTVDTNIGATLSTFTPILGQNLYPSSSEELRQLGLDVDTKGTIFVMKHTETLCLLGTCKLTLLVGTISLNGVTLKPSLTSHKIFAPRSSPLPILEHCYGDSMSAIDVTPLRRVISLPPGSQSTVFVLQELNSGVEGLGRVCNTFERIYAPSASQEESISAPFQIDGLYLVRRRTRDICAFILPESWSTALSLQPSNPIFLVKGPKKCGKSTFTRTLLNNLLTRYQRVAYLECDLGQSEFTPGGLVALNVVSYPILGPNFTHPTLPIRSHYIGSATPRSSPSHYIDAIQNIVQKYRLDIHNPLLEHEENDSRISDSIPLVVNTMGWFKGLGADLNQKIEDILEPGQVFEFQGDEFALPATSAHVLEPAPLSSLTMNFTAADHRTISILSYFHAVFPNSISNELEQVTAQQWDTSLPLCAVPPYEIDLQKAVDRVVLTGSGSEDVVSEEVVRVLNGALVGLVRADYPYSIHEPGEFNSESAGTSLPYIQNSIPPSPSDSTCVGIALIRGIDSETSLLHLLTPVPPSLLNGMRVLVKGEMELPVWGMLDFRGDGNDVAGVEKMKVPFLRWGRGSDGALGAQRRRVRRNLMRRGQA